MRIHVIQGIVAVCLAFTSVACGGRERPEAGDEASPASKDPNKPTAAPEDTRKTPPADDEETDPLADLDPQVLRAAEIANSITAAPESADDVLAQADLDREDLDALMYEIAVSPELTSQYRIARGLQ